MRWDLAGSSYFESHSKETRRVVYPYSVIAGGVRSTRELKEAISKDPVVAAHYAGFRADRTRIVELPAEKAVYVSYRLGNEVFWTSKKIKLAQGEKLITDGENCARARCGNRISEEPQPKTSPEEPSPKTLETAQDPSDRELIAALEDSNPPSSSESLATPPPGPTPIGAPPTGGGVFVPIIPIVPVSGSPPPNGNPPVPPPPPITPIPEPGTLVLVASGLAGLLGFSRKFRK